ncbi:MAG: hypothetical protein KDH15_04800 [Rhodocyclaceae bacterium]|nr:hypothetical protein [Rhodocyclaceae bacterium]
MRDRIYAMAATTLWLACAAGPAVHAAAPPPPRDYDHFDVCKAVPGEVFEKALGATLTEVRPFFDKSFARCVYLLKPTAGGVTGYALWIQPAEDFAELRKYIDDPVTAVDGLGDNAYLFRDSGDGRYKLNVLKRGDLMFQVTAGNEADVRRLAAAVWAALAGSSR